MFLEKTLAYGVDFLEIYLDESPQLEIQKFERGQ